MVPVKQSLHVACGQLYKDTNRLLISPQITQGSESTFFRIWVKGVASSPQQVHLKINRTFSLLDPQSSQSAFMRFPKLNHRILNLNVQSLTFWGSMSFVAKIGPIVGLVDKHYS